MTLLELLTGALKSLERGTDAQTIEAWRDKLTRYINDAVLDLANQLQPRRTDTVCITGGAIDLSLLPRRAFKIGCLCRGGKRYAFYYGGSSDELRVPGLPDGEAELTYRYVPKPLVSDTDVPELPETCHGALITYAVARERAMGDAASISAARGCFELYLMAKKSLRADMGEADAYRIENRYA